MFFAETKCDTLEIYVMEYYVCMLELNYISEQIFSYSTKEERTKKTLVGRDLFSVLNPGTTLEGLSQATYYIFFIGTFGTRNYDRVALASGVPFEIYCEWHQLPAPPA